jgi:hypothetical protein
MKENEINRRLDLSTKFIKMGQSLINEGKENNDLGIAQVGTVLVFISGLIIGSDEDIFKFSDFCSMFSSRKILDSIQGHDPIFDGLINNKKIDGDTYDDFVKKLNGLKTKKKGKKGDDKN